MRVWSVVVSWLVLGAPALLCAQSGVVHGSGGPTLVDRGYSLAAGAGWSPWSRVTVSLNGEHTHLASRTTSDGRGGSAGFRGGTVAVGTAEAQLALWPRDRVTPYLVAGYAVGVSRPNVTRMFPARVTNPVRAFVYGAGMQVPLSPRLAAFADLRLQLGEEANELFAVVPLRAGFRWSF